MLYQNEDTVIDSHESGYLGMARCFNVRYSPNVSTEVSYLLPEELLWKTSYIYEWTKGSKLFYVWTNQVLFAKEAHKYCYKPLKNSLKLHFLLLQLHFVLTDQVTSITQLFSLPVHIQGQLNLLKGWSVFLFFCSLHLESCFPCLNFYNAVCVNTMFDLVSLKIMAESLWWWTPIVVGSPIFGWAVRWSVSSH